MQIWKRFSLFISNCQNTKSRSRNNQNHFHRNTPNDYCCNSKKWFNSTDTKMAPVGSGISFVSFDSVRICTWVASCVHLDFNLIFFVLGFSWWQYRNTALNPFLKRCLFIYWHCPNNFFTLFFLIWRTPWHEKRGHKVCILPAISEFVKGLWKGTVVCVFLVFDIAKLS